MKTKVKIVDLEKLIFDIKRGQKRKSWIRVQAVEERLEISTCLHCLYNQTCNFNNDRVCAKVVSEVVGSGHLFYISHYNLLQIRC